MNERSEVVHGCPTSGGLTPCCRVTPFELPRGDRMASDTVLVTCWTGDDPRLTPAHPESDGSK